ncbi:hypothetical protein [Basilea psittacipulmonis]|uniref:Uncharacterized protein n=1 Tax=Basilea psittacipulmonis DSM 24701 TaxID=1072685 RepID=A0A077DCN6_9BURK|nr:hypothetical protein [Basilea psittacipulmonis]AIL32650.1 hypothetical protein IX83_04410 [Basilea psittacipulmonis DSM 24701]
MKREYEDLVKRLLNKPDSEKTREELLEDINILKAQIYSQLKQSGHLIEMDTAECVKHITSLLGIYSLDYLLGLYGISKSTYYNYKNKGKKLVFGDVLLESEIQKSLNERTIHSTRVLTYVLRQKGYWVHKKDVQACWDDMKRRDLIPMSSMTRTDEK